MLLSCALSQPSILPASGHRQAHPKTLVGEIAKFIIRQPPMEEKDDYDSEVVMALSTNSGSFPSNSHVSATFSILVRFGESWNPTNCERFNADGSLMGRTNLDKSVW